MDLQSQTGVVQRSTVYNSDKLGSLIFFFLKVHITLQGWRGTVIPEISEKKSKHKKLTQENKGAKSHLTFKFQRPVQ